MDSSVSRSLRRPCLSCSCRTLLCLCNKALHQECDDPIERSRPFGFFPWVTLSSYCSSLCFSLNLDTVNRSLVASKWFQVSSFFLLPFHVFGGRISPVPMVFVVWRKSFRSFISRLEVLQNCSIFLRESSGYVREALTGRSNRY